MGGNNDCNLMAGDGLGGGGGKGSGGGGRRLMFALLSVFTVNRQYVICYSYIFYCILPTSYILYFIISSTPPRPVCQGRPWQEEAAAIDDEAHRAPLLPKRHAGEGIEGEITHLGLLIWSGKSS